MTCPPIRRGPHARIIHGAGCLVGALLAGCGEDFGSGVDPDSSGSAGSTTVVDPTDPGSSGPAESSSGDASTDPTGSMTTTPTPECGNGVREDPEQCDDGNLRPGDGCDVDCTEVVDSTQWSDVVPGDAAVEEAAQAVAFDGAGNLVVAGWIVDVVGAPDVWLRKYAPDGTELWTEQLDPSAGATDRAFGVAIADDETIAVTGTAGVGETTGDIWIAQLSSDGGAPLWEQLVDGPAGENDIGHGIAVDAGGNVWVTGFVRVANGDDDIWVGEYDAAGTELFSDIVAGPSDLEDRGQGVAVDAEGNAFVTGYVSDVRFDGDVWLRKYAADGTVAWTIEFDGASGGVDEGYGVAVAPDGSVGVAGFTAVTAINEDVWLGHFASEDGALIWQKKFGGPEILNDRGLAVASDSQGAFIVCGFKGIADVDTDIWVRKWGGDGTVAWTQSVLGAGGNRDFAHGIAVDAADDIAVVGELREHANNDADIWVAKLGGTP